MACEATFEMGVELIGPVSVMDKSRTVEAVSDKLKAFCSVPTHIACRSTGVVSKTLHGPERQ
jgi:hypothetical protein